MIKKISLALSLILLSATLSGCGLSPGKTAAPGEQFTLAIGETENIRGENLKVTFKSVLEDSRYPTGATCVWEGRATSQVTIVSNNTTQVELTEPGLTASPYQYAFGNYVIFFHLEPYPEIGKQITPDQYRLTMAISKPN